MNKNSLISSNMQSIFTFLLLFWNVLSFIVWNGIQARSMGYYIWLRDSFNLEQFILLFTLLSLPPPLLSLHTIDLLKKHPSVVLYNIPVWIYLCFCVVSFNLFYNSCDICKREVRAKGLTRFHSFVFLICILIKFFGRICTINKLFS